MDIIINGIGYSLETGMNTLLEWERFTGRSLKDITVSLPDSLKFFFCTLKAANPLTWEYTYSDFLELVLTNPDLLVKYSGYVINSSKITLTPDGQISEADIKRNRDIIDTAVPIYDKMKDQYKKKLN